MTPWPEISGFTLYCKEMPDERREIQLKRPASHSVLSTFYSYTTPCGFAQGGSDEVDSPASPALPKAFVSFESGRLPAVPNRDSGGMARGHFIGAFLRPKSYSDLFGMRGAGQLPQGICRPAKGGWIAEAIARTSLFGEEADNLSTSTMNRCY